MGRCCIGARLGLRRPATPGDAHKHQPGHAYNSKAKKPPRAPPCLHELLVVTLHGQRSRPREEQGLAFLRNGSGKGRGRHLPPRAPKNLAKWENKQNRRVRAQQQRLLRRGDSAKLRPPGSSRKYRKHLACSPRVTPRGSPEPALCRGARTGTG